MKTIKMKTIKTQYFPERKYAHKFLQKFIVDCRQCGYYKEIDNTRTGWELAEKIKKQHKDGEHLKAVWLFPCKYCWDAKKACETHVDCMHALNDLAYRETVSPYGIEISVIKR